MPARKSIQPSAFYHGRVRDGLHALINTGAKFKTIYADPATAFRPYSEKGKQRSAERHYPVESDEEICSLPVAEVADKDSTLVLWTSGPMLPLAMRIIDAWGFKYQTLGFDWIKMNRRGPGLFWGMGFWTRSNPELALLATRGNPHRLARDVHSVIISRVSSHSRKPDEAQRRIERLLAGPFLELYGRRAVPGWAVVGNEVGRNLFTQDIPDLRSLQASSLEPSPGAAHPDTPVQARRSRAAGGEIAADAGR